jgi:hypothetical protein
MEEKFITIDELHSIWMTNECLQIIFIHDTIHKEIKKLNSILRFMKQAMNKSKRSSHRRLPPIRLGEIIDYKNINLLHKGEQGRILSR